jgi:hypothetical protein
MAPRSSQYQPPTEPMSISEKAAHFLAWCEKHRPGEYISYAEIAQTVHTLKTRPTKKHATTQGILRSSGHICRLLFQKFQLGWDSQKNVGVRAINDVHDIVKLGVVKGVEQIAAGERKLSKSMQLVDQRKNDFAATEEGKRLKKFVGRVKASVSSLALPSKAEIKGLLVGHDDD